MKNDTGEKKLYLFFILFLSQPTLVLPTIADFGFEQKFVSVVGKNKSCINKIIKTAQKLSMKVTNEKKVERGYSTKNWN